MRSPTHSDPLPASLDRLYSKVTWHLVPFLFIFFVVAYLDRVNVAFAKLEMLQDLGWSDSVYGLGAGMFFVGYFIFEVPSNLILYRMGARRWLACMMIVWGVLSSAMMFITTPAEFYSLRFAIGLAEAGFFPGIIFYLSMWVPKRRRGKITALFMTAIAISNVVGGPLSGWIMRRFHGVYDMDGWQWLFLLEGLPSVALGVLALCVLDDSIRSAKWLTEGEKDVLDQQLALEEDHKAHLSLWETLSHPRVWLLSLIYFFLIMGLYGVLFWLPQLIKDTGVKDIFHVGLLTAIPYFLACGAMVWMGRHSDHSGERRQHIAWCTVAGCVGLTLSGLHGNSLPLVLISLTLATAGILSALPVFWSLPTEFLGGTAAAAGIGLINSIGNLAGCVSPFMIGAITQATGKTALGLYVVAGSLTIGGGLVMLFVKPHASSHKT